MRIFKKLSLTELEKNSKEIKVAINSSKNGGSDRLVDLAFNFRSGFNMFYSLQCKTIVVFNSLPDFGTLIGLEAVKKDKCVITLKKLYYDKTIYNNAVSYNEVEEEMKERIEEFAKGERLYYKEDWMSCRAYNDYHGIPMSRGDMSKSAKVNLKQVIPKEYDCIKSNLKDTPEMFKGTFLEMICTIRDDILKHFKFDILAANARYFKLKMKDSSGKEIDVPVQDFFDMFQSIHSHW